MATSDAAFLAFGAAAAALSGGDQKDILKFDKGDWYLGQDKEEVPRGAKLAANIMEAEWGWVRWRDGKPVERRMVRIASGAQAATRDALGHLDEQLWERDNQGKARDPWQFMIEIPAREVAGGKREVLLSGGSRGWEGCCKALFQEFGQQMREQGGKAPIVELGSDKYEHKQYGIVKTPLLKIVEWKSATELEQKAETKKIATKF
jgi:hypothetical protein